jgi:hypothetical protein
MQRTRLLVRLPKRQGERLEAVLQLVIGAGGQVGLAGADADQRDAQLVAQEPDQVQELAAHVAAAGQNVAQLVDDQDPDPGRAQQRQRHLLQLGQPLSASGRPGRAPPNLGP